MKINLIGAPIEEGCEIYGSRKSIQCFEEEMDIDHIVEVDHDNNDHIQVVYDSCRQIKQYCQQAYSNNEFPLVFGGDHSLAIGSLAAIKNLKNTAILWVDAHADINSDSTSITKRIHGMPLSVALHDCYPSLVSLMDHEILDINNLYYLALRSVDTPEQKRIDDNHVIYFTIDDIKQHGLLYCLEELKRIIQIPVHLSMDLDAIDPSICSGVNTPVCDGIRFEEFLDIIRFSFENFEIISADIVEYNPINDDGNTKFFVKKSIELMKEYIEKKEAQ